MDDTFEFIVPPELVDGELALILDSTGMDGPDDEPFAVYRFHMIDVGPVLRMGGIRLRIGEVEGPLRYACNIGFDVFRQYRGHRYAVRSTRLVATVARMHGMSELWISCDEHNHASRACCRLLDAELVDTIDVPDGIDLAEQGIRRLQRYRMRI